MKTNTSRSIGDCKINPLPYKRMDVSEAESSKDWGSVGFFGWVYSCVFIGFMLRFVWHIEKWYIWGLPIFAIAAIIAFYFVKILVKGDAINQCNKQNNELQGQRLRESESATELTKKNYQAILHAIDDLEQRGPALEIIIKQARAEYEDSAYAPFWDRVHDSIVHLYACQEDINVMVTSVKEYSEALQNREHNFPELPALSGLIPDIRAMSVELNSVIRQGQTNFNFASIYEQRRTRQVMIAGFRYFGDAVDSIATSIDRSFSDLHSVWLVLR